MELSELMWHTADIHHDDMGWWPMMGTWGWFWMFVWIAVFLVIGISVYRDAEKRGMNGLLWLILVILPMIGLLFLLIYLVVREEHTTEKWSGDKSPERILDERYAKGEITSEEYSKMKKKLRI